MSKVQIKRNTAKYSLQFMQEGSLGIVINEGDLPFLVDALKEPDVYTQYYAGRIGVYRKTNKIVLYTLYKGLKRDCISLETKQASRLLKVLTTSFRELLEQYEPTHGVMYV